MKKSAILLAVIALLLLHGMFACHLLHTEEISENDVVKINELQKEIAQYYPAITQDAPIHSTYAYAILDAQEQLLYASNADVSTTLYDAIQHQDLILDITQENKTVGKLIIYNSQLMNRKAQRHQSLWLLGLLTLLEVIILVVYWQYLCHILFHPFEKLQRFALRVAGGDLDFPLEMDRKNVFGAFSESFDLMRDELKLAKQKELEANQSKKELVAKLSHDIKTPVASILAVSELMSVQVTSPKEKQQLQIIDEKANQINTLVSDLFHASLEELQELCVHPTETSSTLLMEQLVCADYQGWAEIAPIPSCMILADSQRLQQVFDNIFANAYKYAQERIQVSSEYREEYLVIHIKDHGIGVKEEELPLLFEKFYRGENAQKKSGVGLGLYISSYLMKQMNGKLSVQNEKDGFLVSIYLQLAV